MFDVLFRLCRSDRTVGSGCYYLAQGFDSDVACGIHAGNVRFHVLVGDNVSGRDHFNLAFVQAAHGVKAYKRENPEGAVIFVCMVFFYLSAFDVFKNDGLNKTIALDFLDNRIP